MFTSARYTAEQMLLDMGISKLPITSKDIQEYLEYNKWDFIAYNLNQEEQIKNLTTFHILDIAKKKTCFSYKMENRKIIFYRQELSEQERLVQFAHELAHIQYDHFSGYRILGYTEDGTENQSQEEEANDFAVEFLAPTYILHQAHIKTEEEIQSYTLLNKKYSGRVLSNLQDKESITGNEKRLSKSFKTYIANHTKHKLKRMTGIAAPVVAVISALTVMLSVFITNHNQEEDIKQVQTTSVPAATEERTQIEAGNVYITTSGKKYHRPTCGFVKNKSNVLEISVEEAIKTGYKPCEVCNP